MGIRELDLRGLSCPLPALEVRKALEGSAGESLTVLLDCGSAEENVPRAAGKAGWSVASRETLPDGTRRLVLERNRGG